MVVDVIHRMEGAISASWTSCPSLPYDSEGAQVQCIRTRTHFKSPTAGQILDTRILGARKSCTGLWQIVGGGAQGTEEDSWSVYLDKLCTCCEGAFG